MYSQAYKLVREILEDEELNAFIFEETGKHLAIIDAGAQITTPAALISFAGGDFSRRSNTNAEVEFTVSFLVPYWGDTAFTRCLEFLDFVVPVFFAYSDTGAYVVNASPAIHEPDDVSEQWSIDITLSVKVFL